jgi:hypothetical protein
MGTLRPSAKALKSHIGISSRDRRDEHFQDSGHVASPWDSRQPSSQSRDRPQQHGS